MPKRFLVATFLLTSVLLAGCQLIPSSSTTPSAQVIDGTTWSKDGNNYSTTINYSSPGGEETNNLHLTIVNGTITAASVDVLTKIDASIVYQKQFAIDFPKLVIGRKLASLTSFSHVSGASLTTDAFNESLKQLQQNL